MRSLTVYEDGYFPQDPIVGGGVSNVTVGGGTQVADAPRGTSQVSTAIPENPSVISEPRPRETYEPLGSDPKPPKTGASVVAEPDLGSSATSPSGTTTSTTSGSGLPNLGGLLGGGGAGGGSSAEQTVEAPKDKKPFPYWILIAGLVGGYLVFRKN
jgi:hypothetical protein